MKSLNWILCLASYLFAQASIAVEAIPNNPNSNDPKRANRRAIAIVLASDGTLQQATVDFYRAVYKTIASGSNWDAIPISTLRQTMSVGRDSNRLGGIPTVDRSTFRKNLPKKVTKKGKSRTVPGTPNAEIQRLLDNLGSPASIVVDCTRMGRDLLKSCSLYYYDRVATHVTASAVKEFTAGANDATVWAAPMVRNLDDGIAAAQREKDQAMIDELVARKEEDESEDIRGTISLFGRGDRMRLNTGWGQTVAGGGLQLGFLRNGIGVNAEIGRLSWQGQGDSSVKSAQRTNYGLNMEFRAKALESLLWLFEIGGGKDDSKFKGQSPDDSLSISGVYVSVGPGVGLEVNDNVTMNLAVSWRWFFEQSSSKSGTLSDASMSASNIPGLTLRATLQL